MFSKHWVGLSVAVAMVTSSASAQPYIDSIYINPPGTDAPKEVLELRGPASGTIPANTYLVFVEGDISSAGDVQTIFNLGGLTYGSNGLLFLRQGSSPYGAVDANTNVITGAGTGWTGVAGFQADAAGTDIENASVTMLVINSATTPTLTDDIDSNDDGTPDGSVYAGWTILDSVAILDGGVSDPGYAQICFRMLGAGNAGVASTVVNLPTGFDVEFFGRRGTSTGFAASDWFVADITENAGPTITVNTGEGFPSSIEGLDVLTTFGGSNATLPVALSEFSAE